MGSWIDLYLSILSEGNGSLLNAQTIHHNGMRLHLERELTIICYRNKPLDSDIIVLSFEMCHNII